MQAELSPYEVQLHPMNDPSQVTVVCLLGGLRFERHGQELSISLAGKATSLLVELALRIDRGARREELLEMFWPEHELTRSNDLPKAYHDAGQFVWIGSETALREKRFYLPGMRPVALPRHRVQDIDTEEDWARAEKLYAVLMREAESTL